jgi:hypothetical protein
LRAISAETIALGIDADQATLQCSAGRSRDVSKFFLTP